MAKALKSYRIGLVDADLLNGGTRHPNLALLKIAGFLRDNGIYFRLITDTDENIEEYDYIYISRVFTFSPIPNFYISSHNKKKFILGGTGFYANTRDIKEFNELRVKDMNLLENDKFLSRLDNYRSNRRKKGIDMAAQMPYYHLYDEFIEKKTAEGRRKSYFDDYKYQYFGKF